MLYMLYISFYSVLTPRKPYNQIQEYGLYLVEQLLAARGSLHLARRCHPDPSDCRCTGRVRDNFK